MSEDKDNNNDYIDSILDQDENMDDNSMDDDFDYDESEDSLPDTEQHFDEDMNDSIDEYDNDSSDNDSNNEDNDDNMSETSPKNKMIPIIIGIVGLIVTLLGGGVYYAMSNSGSKAKTVTVQTNSPNKNSAGESFKAPLENTIIPISEKKESKKVKDNMAGQSFNSPSTNIVKKITPSDIKNESGIENLNQNLSPSVRKKMEADSEFNDINLKISTIGNSVKSNKLSIDDIKKTINKFDAALNLKIEKIDAIVSNMNKKMSSSPVKINKKKKTIKNNHKITHNKKTVIKKDNRLKYDVKYIINGTVWLQESKSTHIVKYTVGDTIKGYGIIREISDSRGVMTANGYLDTNPVSIKTRASKNKPTIHLIGSINGKAWVKSMNNDKVYPVVVGDKIRGYGIITSINANGIIKSETGIVKTILK